MNPSNHLQPVIAALLLSFAVGVLALALIRVVAFAAGGIASWLMVHYLAPPGWDDPVLCFVVGGLIGLGSFRLWTMVLTSFCGVILLAYFGLSLADHCDKLNAVSLSEGNPTLISWICLAGAVVGVVLQMTWERQASRRRKRWEEAQGHGIYRWPQVPDEKHWWNFGRSAQRRVG
jgi:hypothetical protein